MSEEKQERVRMLITFHGIREEIFLPTEFAKVTLNNWITWKVKGENHEEGEKANLLLVTPNGAMDLRHALGIVLFPMELPERELSKEEKEAKEYTLRGIKASERLVELYEKRLRDETRGDDWKGDDEG